MILYHFTQEKNKDAIIRDGIKTGVFPFQEKVPVELVSLTAHLSNEKHGLFSGQTVVEGSRAFEVLAPIFPSLVSGSAPDRRMKMHDQKEVVIEVEIPETDGNLLDIWKFAGLVNQYLNTRNPMILVAASLATADFPCNDASEQVLDSLTLQYLKPIVLQREASKRGWYFYKGGVTASMFKRVLYRQGDGSYGPHRSS